MKIKQLEIEGLLVVEPKLFKDKRGYFQETFNKNTWKQNGLTPPNFVQDNESMSQKGVLRGLHFQKPPFQQGKLVRVVKGSVLDVVVDLRKNAKTYGKHYKIVLSSENKLQFYVPEGFAHGFLTLEDDTIFSYKCTNYYNHASEDGLMWNDPVLNIDWGTNSPVLSDKDETYISFVNFVTPFE